MFEDAIIHCLNRRHERRNRHEGTGLVFGTLSDSRQPVHWPQGKRAEHMAVVGKTGSGKTHFMEHLAAQLMQRGEPFVFFDFHGDATQHLIALAAQEKQAADRLVVIDPADEVCSPGLNPLETSGSRERQAFARSAELASILRQRWHVDAFGPRTEELLRNSLFLLSGGGYTLVELPLLLTSARFRDRLLSAVSHPDILDYWQQRYEPLSDAMKGAFREPLLNKVTGFLTEPASRHLLGQAQSSLSFARAADAGQWVLLNLSKGHLREHAHTLGNLVFARLQFEILGRASQREADRRLLTVFCDEVQNLAENDLATLLSEGRKFRVSLITGNQYLDQLSREFRGALLSSGTHVFFDLSSSDAGTLAGELSVVARQRYHRELTSLTRGQALVRIGAGSPLSISVPALPKAASPAAADRLRSLSVAHHARPRTDIEHEIRGRREQFRSAPPLTPIPHDESPLEGQHGW